MPSGRVRGRHALRCISALERVERLIEIGVIPQAQSETILERARALLRRYNSDGMRSLLKTIRRMERGAADLFEGQQKRTEGAYGRDPRDEARKYVGVFSRSMARHNGGYRTQDNFREDWS